MIRKTKFNTKTTPLFRQVLLDWYHKNKRDLPFRHTKDPYKIWLSEIMLQQTTVSAVVDYYERFIKEFPDVASVANAKEERLLALWQGLGYYSRIRNFQIACRQVMTNFEGIVPSSFEGLRSLKGIGDYTAAAVSSISFAKPHAVVDGNVKRVLARLFYYEGEINAKASQDFFRSKADELLDHANPGDYNQAVMELGATVCRPKSPTCQACPVERFCLAKNAAPETLPVVKKQKFIDVEYVSLLIRHEDQILFKKPATDNLIAGMWELPSLYHQNQSAPLEWKKLFKTNFHANKLVEIGAVRHGITNKKILTRVYAHPTIKLNHSDYVFVSACEVKSIPVNTLSRKILKKFGS